MPKKKMGRPRRDDNKTKLKFLETYEKLNCQLQTTCRALKIAPNTIRNWRKFKDVVDGVEVENRFNRTMCELERLLQERVEGKLLDDALEGKNIVASIFYLKNNWKEKYGENQQIEVTPSKLWFEKKDVKQIEGD